MTPPPSAETPVESSAADRGRLVVRMAVRVFADGSRAVDWLSKPNGQFQGQSPLFVATTSAAGCARVCRLLENLMEG